MRCLMSLSRRLSAAGRSLMVLGLTAGLAESATRAAEPLPEAARFAKSTRGVLVVRPKQIYDSALGQTFVATGHAAPLGPNQLFRPEQFERVTATFDEATFRQFARENGIDLAGGADGPSPRQLQNNLKMVGLAMHNYHDTHGHFPAAGSSGRKEAKAGLSWRVHLLPYLEEMALYNRFKLDEPWDSDHNKALIPLMPKLFRSPGVTEEGKTSLAVYAGPKTLFPEKEGLRMAKITDGTSNTLMAVTAGPDTAEVWTKPGGLDFDPEKCKDALGKIPAAGFWILNADGSVRRMPASIAPEDLARLITPAGGEVIDYDRMYKGGGSSTLPDGVTAYLTAAEPFDAEALKHLFPEAESIREGAVLTGPGPLGDTLGGVLVGKNLLIIGDEKGLEDQTKPSAAPPTGWTNSVLPEADLALVVVLGGQQELIDRLAAAQPQLQDFKGVQGITVNVTFFNAKEGEPILRAEIKTSSPEIARTKVNTVRARLNVLAAFAGAGIRLENGKEIQKMIRTTVSTAKYEADGSTVRVTLTAPPGFESLPELLTPELISGPRGPGFPR